MKTKSSNSRWLGCALIPTALAGGLALLVPDSPAKDPGDKTAQGVQETPAVAQPAARGLLPRLSESEQQIEAALAKNVTCKFVEKPLSQVVEDLAKQVDLPIELDSTGLEEAGIAQGTPITLEAGPLSLRAVMKLLEVRHQLAYAPSLAGLKITSLEVEGWAKVSRVYPVFDLLDRSEEDPLEDNLSDLIDTITSQIEPDSWTDNGGSASIAGYRGRLVVEQSLARHYDLSLFLTALRKLRQSPAPAPDKPLTVVEAARGPAHDALAKRLTGEATGDLNEFLEQMGNALKIPLVVSFEGLENAGLDLKASISGTYRDQPGGNVLQGLLKPHGLAPVVFPEFVLITSEDEADQGRELRFYRIDDIADADQPGGLDAISDLITSSVEADSWTDNGGSGVISTWTHPPAVVVTARFDLHAKIEQLLTSFRESSQEKAALDRKADEQIVKKVYPLYLKRRELKVELARPKTDAPATPATAPPAATPPAGAPAAPAKDEDDARREQPVPPKPIVAQFGGGMMGLGGSCFGLPGMRGAGQVTEPIPKAGEVAELIQDLLPDPSWKEEGVLLKPFHDTLIIRQRPPMLRKIEKLLEEIDAWHAPPPAMQLPMMNGGMMGGGGGFF